MRTDPGREVEVHTYHGFAARLLEEFGALVGVERDSKLITPTFGRQLLREALASDARHRLDLTNPWAVEKLVTLGSMLGDQLATPEALQAAAPDQPDEVWEERLEIAGALEGYRKEKRRLRVVDFSDLIASAHELMAAFPEVAQRVASRYRVVLLDEYQDTNPAQRELLRTIFGDGFPVTAVGDPDQTIYEWRGASLENFAEFPDHFRTASGEPAATLPLTLNRRSGRLVLDLANRARARVGDLPRDDLRPLPDAPEGTVAVHWARTAMDESRFIADRLVHLHDQGRLWKDMAVLFRKNKDILLVHDALEQADIPVEVANLGGLLAIPEVADVHAWLRILGDPDDGPALLRVLMGSRFRLGMGDLRPAADWVGDRRSALPAGSQVAGSAHPADSQVAGSAHPADSQVAGSAAMAAEDHDLPGPSLLEAIDHPESLEGLEPMAAEALAEFRRLYRGLLRNAQGVSLVELVRRILSQTGAWQEVEAMSDHARLSARLNLHRFLDLAEDWSPLEGRPSLVAFLDYLRLMEAEQPEELDTARLSGEDAVALLTVHRAKGLEWPVVFLPALYRGNFPSSSSNYQDPYRRGEVLPFALRLDAGSLPPLTDAMTDEERKGLLRPRHLSGEWRIAYVAVTRAKEELYLTGASWYGSPEPRKKPVEPSELFELAAAAPEVADLGLSAHAGERPAILRFELDPHGPDPAFRDGWDGALRAALADPDWARAEAAKSGVVGTYDAAVGAFQ
ncbi:MAG: ATP-dependent helicase, partial [Acidimicrobiia bacterium]